MFNTFRIRIFRRVRRRRRILKVPKKFEQEKEVTRALVHARLLYFNQYYNFSYNKVFIRNQRSRWASCSTKRNLNFHYKIGQLPPALADYIIVHELCHLGQFNHSPAFWALVVQKIPDHKAHRATLRKISL